MSVSFSVVSVPLFLSSSIRRFSSPLHDSPPSPNIPLHQHPPSKSKTAAGADSGTTTNSLLPSSPRLIPNEFVLIDLCARAQGGLKQAQQRGWHSSGLWTIRGIAGEGCFERDGTE